MAISLNRLPITEADVRVINGELVALHGSGRKTTPIEIELEGADVAIDNSGFSVLGGTTAQEVFESVDFQFDNLGGAFPLDNEEWGQWRNQADTLDLNIIRVDSADNTVLNAIATKEIHFSVAQTLGWRIDANRHLIPESGRNLGSNSSRVSIAYLTNFITQDGTVEGNLIVEGNLTVTGTTTTLNTEELLIEDNIITLNSTHTGVPALDAGIEVNRGSEPNARILWDESADVFVAGISGSEEQLFTIPFDNDNWLPWTDFAGTGTVDVIKVDASDEIEFNGSNVATTRFRSGAAATGDYHNGGIFFHPYGANNSNYWFFQKNTGIFAYAGQEGIIRADSVNNLALHLSGGGAQSAGNGGRVQLYGQSHATYPGQVHIGTGSGLNKTINFSVGHTSGEVNTWSMLSSNLQLQSDFIYNLDGQIRAGTENGSDSLKLTLAGGGDDNSGIGTGTSTDRGAMAVLFGNEHSTNGGELHLRAGNVSSGTISFETLGTEQWRINSLGKLLAASGVDAYIGINTPDGADTGSLTLSASDAAGTTSIDQRSGRITLHGLEHSTNPGGITLHASAATGSGDILFNTTIAGNSGWTMTRNVATLVARGVNDAYIIRDGAGNAGTFLMGYQYAARTEYRGNSNSTDPGVLRFYSGSNSDHQIEFFTGNHTGGSYRHRWTMPGGYADSPHFFEVSELVFEREQAAIHAGTSVGSDTGSLILAAFGREAVAGRGPLADESRGACIELYGTDHLTNPDDLVLKAGTTSTSGKILVHSSIEASASGTLDIGTASEPFANLHVDTLHVTSISGIELESVIHPNEDWEQWYDNTGSGVLDVLSVDSSNNVIIRNSDESPVVTRMLFNDGNETFGSSRYIDYYLTGFTNYIDSNSPLTIRGQSQLALVNNNASGGGQIVMPSNGNVDISTSHASGEIRILEDYFHIGALGGSQPRWSFNQDRLRARQAGVICQENSDSNAMFFAGGTDIQEDHGAYIAAFGTGHATSSGILELHAGDNDNAEIELHAQGEHQWSITERANLQAALRFVRDAGAIYGSTADGSDVGALTLCGGGDASNNRGALIILYGNEHSGAGNLVLSHGGGSSRVCFNSSNSAFGFRQGNLLEMKMSSPTLQPQVRFEPGENGGYLDITGGSNANTSLGSYVMFRGNDNAILGGAQAGQLRLGAGDAEIVFITDPNTERWHMVPAGHFIPQASGTYDIGSAALPLRDIYAQSITTQASPGARLSSDGSRGILDSSEDNDLRIQRNSVPFIQLEDGHIIFTQPVTMESDLNVSGTNNIINTEQLLVEDNIITLNSTASGTPTLDSGFEVNRGNEDYAQLLWDESEDYFVAGISGSLEKVIVATDSPTDMAAIPNDTPLQIQSTSGIVDVLSIDSSNRVVIGGETEAGSIVFTPEPTRELEVGFGGGSFVQLTSNSNLQMTANAGTLRLYGDDVNSSSIEIAGLAQGGDISISAQDDIRLLATDRIEYTAGGVVQFYMEGSTFRPQASGTKNVGSSAYPFASVYTELLNAGESTLEEGRLEIEPISQEIFIGGTNSAGSNEARVTIAPASATHGASSYIEVNGINGPGSAGILLRGRTSVDFEVGADHHRLRVQNGISFFRTQGTSGAAVVSDTSDTGALLLAGGQTFDNLNAPSGLSSFILSYGRSHATEAGNLHLGAHTSGRIRFSTGTTDKWAIDNDGSFVGYQSVNTIHTSTSNSSDNARITIGGGGDTSTDRGAVIEVRGNEAGSGGGVTIATGQTGIGRIDFQTGSASTVSRWSIDSAGTFIPSASGTYDIGSASQPVDTLYVDNIVGVDLGSGGPDYQEETGTSATLAVNTEYSANNASLVTLTLPATAAAGDKIRVIAKGAGGFRIAQNAGQVIHHGSNPTTSGAGGYIESTSQYDVLEIQCITDDTVFAVVSSIGNFNTN